MRSVNLKHDGRELCIVNTFCYVLYNGQAILVDTSVFGGNLTVNFNYLSY